MGSESWRELIWEGIVLDGFVWYGIVLDGIVWYGIVLDRFVVGRVCLRS